jgi:hypothetical protein
MTDPQARMRREAIRHRSLRITATSGSAGTREPAMPEAMVVAPEPAAA